MTILPYRDPSLPIESRVDDLLSRLSAEEKAGQLTQYFYFGPRETEPLDELDLSAIPTEALAFVHQPKMVRDAVAQGRAGSVLFVKNARETNLLQRLAVESSPHGIPLLFGFDVIHGLRTIFPVPIALAASWDMETIEATQAVAAREARSVGIHWSFAPMVDIARDPRWGRIVEGAGEDPYLGSRAAAAAVRGFQGRLGNENVLSGPKHFLGYGAARGGRDYEDAEISDSELWNVYLPPFRAAVEAGARSIMSAYMDLNGVPATGSSRLLRDLLRDELDFDGFVVSDANAVKSLETQHFAASATDAAVRALSAGIDMEMCIFDPAFTNLPQAAQEGRIDLETVDTSVRRVLTAKFQLGLFEKPYADESESNTVLQDPSHRELARISAERTAVLLKNEGALPLDERTLGSIAVIGQLADSRRDILGPWVFDHDIAEAVTILDGIRARVAPAVRVDFAPGASVPPRVFPSMFDDQDPTAANTAYDYDDDAEIDCAVELAESADVAVVVVGERQNQIGEKASRSTLELPGRQLEQLQRIARSGTPVILLVMSGRPLDLRWAQEHIGSIMQIWYPGTRGGEAVANLLFGDTSPAGKLPFTWPRHVGQVPMIYSHLRTFQPENQNARYWDEESTPLYPFGFGQSYASFEYQDVRVDRGFARIGETVSVSADVTNTSDRDADEVAQLYVHQRQGSGSRPVRELKGFERLVLAAGRTRTVTFTLGPRELGYWSSASRGWVQDATVLDIWIGGSSTAEQSTRLIIQN